MTKIPEEAPKKIPYYQEKIIRSWSVRVVKLNITWQKLSEASGVSTTTLSQVKNLQNKPHKKTLDLIEKAFDKLEV